MDLQPLRCRLSPELPQRPRSELTSLAFGAQGPLGERAIRGCRTCSPPARYAEVIIGSLRAGNKLLVIGNGTAWRQPMPSLGAESSGRYKQDRPAYAGNG